MRYQGCGLLVVALALPAFGQQTVNVEQALQQAQDELAQASAQLAPGSPERRKLEAELEKAKTVLQRNSLQPGFDADKTLQEVKTAIAQLDTTVNLRQNLELIAQAKEKLSLQTARSYGVTYSGGSYDGGTRALNDHRYEDAIRQFDAVINAKSSRSDGALYWKAYALDRAGRKDEALAAIAKLRQEFPQSRWLNDAQVLESSVKQGTGQPVSAATEANEDLKLMAINSLMNADPERAIPLLEGLLKGNSAPSVKERALFVLTQSKAPRAAQLLSEYARGAGNPDMQLRAIRYLGMSGSTDGQQQLAAVYSASSDLNVKREIIRALMMARATDQIFALAKNEKESELRIEAIRQLGMMAVSGDKLLELAKGEKDPKVRSEAIRSMAMNKGTSVEAILQFYGSETDAKVRRELINGLSMRGEVKTLVDLARKESDPATKKMIVERLSLSKSKEATEYMMELLK